MKSEHRHELKTNELSRLTTMIWQTLETWTNQHTNQLMWGLAAAVVLVVGIVIWSQQSSSVSTAGWSEMATASTAEDFANVADKYAGTSTAAWAKLKESEGLLRSGVSFSLTDRASSVSDLNRAQEGFEQILNSGSTPADVRERALFGLARCREALADGNLEPAIEVYERLLREYPQSVFQPLAARRIDVLKTGSAQDFYTWFQKQNPKPPDREQPRDGGTGDADTESETSASSDGGPQFPGPDFSFDDAAGEMGDEPGTDSTPQPSNDRENSSDEADEKSPVPTPNSADSDDADEASTAPDSP